MSKLPVVSGNDMVKFLKSLGYEFHRQRGSHITMRNDDFSRNAIVPNHKEIPKGTLLSIIKQTGLTRDQFVHLYERLK